MRGLADAVVNNMDSLSIREPLGFSYKIQLRIEDHLIGSRFARQRGLFLGARRSDHSRSNIFRHLNQKESNASGSGVNQGRLAFLQGIGIVKQILGGL